MSWKTTCSVLTISILLATTVSADVFPFFNSRRNVVKTYPGEIEFTAGKLPKGMLLLYIDNQGKEIGEAHQNDQIIIRRAGTLYGFLAGHITTTFSYTTDKAKLIKLREVTDNDIPIRSKNYPNSVTWYCNVVSLGHKKYKLDCTTPQEHSKPPDKANK
jgi:hypothetical protein